MAKPVSRDEYYEKMKVVRDLVKSFKNQLVKTEAGKYLGEAVDLHKVKDDDLSSFELTQAGMIYERKRLDALKAVYDALVAFDQASS